MHSLRRSARVIAVVTIAITVALSACGGGSDDDPQAADPTTTTVSDGASDDTTTTTAATDPGDESGDGCDLFSDDVAAEVLGIEIVRREPHEDEFGNLSCIKGTERVQDLSQGSYVSASLLPNGGVLVDQATDQEGSVQVAGIGDRAVFVPAIGALLFTDGTDAFQIQVVKGGAPSTDQADGVAVAHDILDNR
jgi:hypothetical protein